jgi:hypothetical protein
MYKVVFSALCLGQYERYYDVLLGSFFSVLRAFYTRVKENNDRVKTVTC